MVQDATSGPAGTGEPAKRWAVIQTGYIDETFNPVAFADGKGRKVAVIVKLCKDEPDARRMLKRLRTQHSRVEWLPGSEFSLCVPIYGVAETDLPLAAKGKAAPVTEDAGNSVTEAPTATKRGRSRK